MKSEPGLDLSADDAELVAGVLARQRRPLAKAITLIESTRHDHQARAQALLAAVLPHSGNSIRIGISGVPGVGKSTFIEALGMHLVEQGRRVAVLAVDPSSSISGGAILGDKTRMERLSRREEAFIRPTPTSGALGGVAEKTREAMLLCEAAGFEVIIVETVGVGQSETSVAAMTDVFVLMQLPNAGDDLQAIKKGIVELTDLVIFNKADLDPQSAESAARQMSSALHLLRPNSPHWQPRVLKISATQGQGIAAFWQAIEDYRQTMLETGEFATKRRRQALAWMWTLIESGLHARFRQHPSVRRELPELATAVEAGEMPPTLAAERLLDCFKEQP
ncbi:MAG: methylmalonyl Co-A mutase-associated GTPase MeaB [Proteobacteria bacterium]|nr:methylmalonyl Co-A mutase-associated GTPase MeaB [Pseudomonadota bacterium]